MMPNPENNLPATFMMTFRILENQAQYIDSTSIFRRGGDGAA
jgi:hypothetical protein